MNNSELSPNEAYCQEIDKALEKAGIEQLSQDQIDMNGNLNLDRILEFKTQEQMFIYPLKQDERLAKQAAHTGIEALDSLNGLTVGFHVLMGTTGTGKTSFATWLADNIARSGTPVLFLSWEDTYNLIHRRRLAKIDFETNGFNALEWGTPLTPAEYKRLSDLFLAEDRGWIYLISDIEAASAERIEQAIDKIKENTGQKPVVIVDNIQYYITSEMGKNALKEVSQRNLADTLVTRFTDIANRNEVAVIALSQINKDAAINRTKDTKDIALLYSASESKKIVERAKTVMLLWEQETTKSEPLCKDITLSVIKNRAGKTLMDQDAIHFDFFPAYCVFKEPNKTKRNSKQDTDFQAFDI